MKQLLRGMVTCIAGLVLLIIMTACSGTVPGVGNAAGGTATITGSITSVDTQNNTVTVSVQGQTYTIKGLTSQQVAALVSQKGRMYTFSASANTDGSYNINNGTEPRNDEGTPGVNEGVEVNTPQANNTETSNVNEPGSIEFVGKVQQVANNRIVVSMPNGQNLTMSIVNGQTDLGDLNGSLPGVGQFVKVHAVANNDGSFTASKLDSAKSTDTQDQSVVKYDGITTSAVGSDRVIRFKVGNQSFGYTIGSGADLHDFNNNAQSISNNQHVKLEVLFQGNSAVVQKVSN